MLLTDYQARARTTAFYPADRGVDYTGHGITSEAGEIAGLFADLLTKHPELAHLDGPARPGQIDTSDLTAEIGDTLWYIALAAFEQRVTIDYDLANHGLHDTTDTPVVAAFRLAAATSYYAGRVKKRIRDGHTSISDVVIRVSLTNALDALAILAVSVGVDLVDAAQQNLDKLASRASRGTLAGDGDHR